MLRTVALQRIEEANKQIQADRQAQHSKSQDDPF